MHQSFQSLMQKYICAMSFREQVRIYCSHDKSVGAFYILSELAVDNFLANHFISKNITKVDAFWPYKYIRLIHCQWDLCRFQKFGDLLCMQPSSSFSSLSKYNLELGVFVQLMSTWRLVSWCRSRRLLFLAFPLLTLVWVLEVWRCSNETSRRSPVVMRFSFPHLLFLPPTFCFAWNCRSFDGLMEFSCWVFREEFRVGCFAAFVDHWSAKAKDLDSSGELPMNKCSPFS